MKGRRFHKPALEPECVEWHCCRAEKRFCKGKVSDCAHVRRTLLLMLYLNWSQRTAPADIT
eukprot:6179330-Amphidinium_carterae.1